MVNKRRAGKGNAAAQGGAGEGNDAVVGKKSKAASLAGVLNLEGIVSDEARWRGEESVAESLASVERGLAKLRQTQRSWRSAIPKRDGSTFAAFGEWLASHGIDAAAAPFRVDVATDGDATDNATLFATREISENETFVTVPSSAMMTSTTASSSSIGDFLSAVAALRGAPSIALALHVLAEALDAESRFRPYIQVLPARFSIPYSLPFSASELLSLRPSRAFRRAVQTLRSQVLQYTKIYVLLSRGQTGCAALSVDNFSYSNFEWAVSVVMTRQNRLPSAGPGRPPALALVPVWDMCNHAAGPHTTSVVLDPATDTARVECGAMRAFVEGEAITIYYGRRPNSELLLYSGFVQPGNEHDSVLVPVAFDGTDRRENVAKVVLLRRQLVEQAGGTVITGTDERGFMTVAGSVLGSGGGVVDRALVAIARVKAGNLDSREGADERDSVDQRAVGVLVDAIKRLQNAYEARRGTRRADDQSADAGVAATLVRALHTEEERILRGALERLERSGLPA
jgi:protein-histidine N-methyltransferase